MDWQVKNTSFRRKKSFSDLTTKKSKDLLTTMLKQFQKQYKDRPDLIISSWNNILKQTTSLPKEAVSMTQIKGIKGGIIIVKIQNSTLYSLLEQYHKETLLKKFQKEFPKVVIKGIKFYLG